SVDGKEHAVRNLKVIGKNLEKGLEGGLDKAAKFLKQESNKIAPEKTGLLIRESFISKEGKGGTTVLQVGYGPHGSKSSDYAVLQHEQFETKKKPDRQWKYLETPFRINIDNMIDMVQKEVERSL